jgi:hypothetical protein
MGRNRDGDGVADEDADAALIAACAAFHAAFEWEKGARCGSLRRARQRLVVTAALTASSCGVAGGPLATASGYGSAPSRSTR